MDRLAQDLSLLTNLSHDDIAHLQTVGKEAQAARLRYILKDDQDKVIAHLESLKNRNARVDFVLDNGVHQRIGSSSERLMLRF